MRSTFCGLCGQRTTDLYPCVRHGRMAPITRELPEWRRRALEQASRGHLVAVKDYTFQVQS